MGISLHELQQQVLSQPKLIPSLYGDVDFTQVPERFTDQLHENSALPTRFASKYQASATVSNGWPEPKPTPCWATPWPMPMRR